MAWPNKENAVQTLIFAPIVCIVLPFFAPLAIMYFIRALYVVVFE